MFEPNKNLENILSKKITSSMLNAGEVLFNQTQRNAPEDTGELKKSGKIDKSKIGSYEIEIKYDADHAKSVEYGNRTQAANPFLRSALAESKDKVLKKFKGII